ncbi:MAG: hypothetical protein JXX14_08735 [Deltaproteobacteria bacterium]|nr:hypothetical protein [Deltaproteobacteria bacterium]
MKTVLNILVIQPESVKVDEAQTLLSTMDAVRCCYTTSMEEPVRLLTLNNFDVAFVDNRFP